MRKKKEIEDGLKKMEQILEKHFKGENPLNVDLHAKTVSHCIERLVRATEICTLKWVLGIGGALNFKKWAYKLYYDKSGVVYRTLQEELTECFKKRQLNVKEIHVSNKATVFKIIVEEDGRHKKDNKEKDKPPRPTGKEQAE